MLNFSRRTSQTVSHKPPELFDEEFHAFQHLIYTEAGIHLPLAKRALVSSRLSKRLRALSLHSFLDYYDFLLQRDSDGTEMQQMINCITTNKTEFYREPHHFKVLAKELQAVDPPASGLRIWSAGCSTGQEPYTIAITLLETFGSRVLHSARILASDIDSQVLATASAGRYPAEEVETLDRSLLRKYFLRGTGGFQRMVAVKPEVARLVSFRQINLVRPKWPVSARFDAIFCRNVIIYFDRETQEQLLRRFASQLRPRGLLFLGHSESMAGAAGCFESIGQTVYRVRS